MTRINWWAAQEATEERNIAIRESVERYVEFVAEHYYSVPGGVQKGMRRQARKDKQIMERVASDLEIELGDITFPWEH